MVRGGSSSRRAPSAAAPSSSSSSVQQRPRRRPAADTHATPTALSGCRRLPLGLVLLVLTALFFAAVPAHAWPSLDYVRLGTVDTRNRGCSATVPAGGGSGSTTHPFANAAVLMTGGVRGDGTGEQNSVVAVDAVTGVVATLFPRNLTDPAPAVQLGRRSRQMCGFSRRHGTLIMIGGFSNGVRPTETSLFAVYNGTTSGGGPTSGGPLNVWQAVAPGITYRSVEGATHATVPLAAATGEADDTALVAWSGFEDGNTGVSDLVLARGDGTVVQLPTVLGPPPRRYGSMALARLPADPAADATRTLLVFGGQADNFGTEVPAELWELTIDVAVPATVGWRSLAPPNPAGINATSEPRMRILFAMAVDAAYTSLFVAQGSVDSEGDICHNSTDVAVFDFASSTWSTRAPTAQGAAGTFPLSRRVDMWVPVEFQPGKVGIVFMGGFSCPAARRADAWLLRLDPLVAPVPPSPAPVESEGEEDDDDDGGGDSTGVIIGVVVGCVICCLICLVLVALFVVRRRRGEQEHHHHHHQAPMTMAHPPTSTPSPANDARYSSLSPAGTGVGTPSSPGEHASLDRRYVIDYSELTVERELARGNFGACFSGQYAQNNCVIKQLHDASPAAREDLLREADMLASLRPHASITQFYGVVDQPGSPLCVVTELVAGGNLEHWLRTPGRPLTGSDAVSLAKDLASGVALLHKSGVLHLDLACRNLLVLNFERPLKLKICDFGLARQLPAGMTALPAVGAQVAWRWLDPAAAQEGSFQRATDTWAVGVCMWELLARDEPFSGKTTAEVMQLVLTGQHLEHPDPAGSLPVAITHAATAEFCEIMDSCWEALPSKRPAMSAVADALSALLAKGEAYLDLPAGSVDFGVGAPPPQEAEEDYEMPSGYGELRQPSEYGTQSAVPVRPGLDRPGTNSPNSGPAHDFALCFARAVRRADGANDDEEYGSVLGPGGLA